MFPGNTELPVTAAGKKPRIHIGTQGWNYDAWVGPFYPINTRPVDFLAVYSRAFGSVEVDSTFYGVPAPATFQSWYDRTPHDFIFTLKLPGVQTLSEMVTQSESAIRLATSAGLLLLSRKHLSYNRHEFTLFFERGSR